MKTFLTDRRRLVFGVVFVLAVNTALFGGPAPKYGRVEILRDSWGVPNVFAATDEGAMYGLGYVCAQDRGFQMHYFLRMMQGRMAEVFGDVEKKRAGGTGPKTTLEHDRVMRMFGFARAWPPVPPSPALRSVGRGSRRRSQTTLWRPTSPDPSSLRTTLPSGLMTSIPTDPSIPPPTQ